jgi:hypothetical protein
MRSISTLGSKGPDPSDIRSGKCRTNRHRNILFTWTTTILFAIKRIRQDMVIYELTDDKAVRSVLRNLIGTLFERDGWMLGKMDWRELAPVSHQLTTFPND